MSFGVTCHLSWTKANTAQCLVPGRSRALMSRWTSDGASRRNDAKELAMPLVAAPSVGIEVRAPLNWNWPRTPPASWIWRRKSSLWRTSVPTLTVWLPVILVSIPTTLNGLLATVPREARRESDHRVREAVPDGDPADAAREQVVVGARDAHLGRAVEARARGERLVVVLHVAGPPLHDQALAEGPRPGEGGAVGVLVAGAGEVGAGAAELAERAGDEDLRPLVAEAQRHLVARGGVVVQLDVEGVRSSSRARCSAARS